jgi:hypothetical protein
MGVLLIAGGVITASFSRRDGDTITNRLGRRTSSFESIILPDRMALEPSKTEPPSESLIALRYKTLREIPSSLESCARCHGGATVRNQIFGFGRPPQAAFLQSDPDEAAATIVRKKEASEEWKSYLRLRRAQAR